MPAIVPDVAATIASLRDVMSEPVLARAPPVVLVRRPNSPNDPFFEVARTNTALAAKSAAHIRHADKFLTTLETIAVTRPGTLTVKVLSQIVSDVEQRMRSLRTQAAEMRRDAPSAIEHLIGSREYPRAKKLIFTLPKIAEDEHDAEVGFYYRLLALRAQVEGADASAPAETMTTVDEAKAVLRQLRA